MKNLKTAISALILLMLAGCNNTRQYFPKQLPPAEIEIVRFDSALLSVRGSEDILRLYADYPGFMGFYSENILGIEATDTAFMLEALPKYLSDTIYHFAEVNRQVMSTFADIRDLRGSLSEAFAKVHYLYPDLPLPQITFFVSGFNASLLFWEPVNGLEDASVQQRVRMALGTDMYLGTDYEYYNRVVWNYQKQTMRRECIPADVVSAYLFRMLPFTSSKSRLLENMIYRGKVMYLLSCIFSAEPEYEIMGYTKQQWQWAKRNEKQVWQMIVDKRDLWKTESPVLTSYLNDGPFTAEISQEAPPRLGTYIGWQIAKSYMETNRSVTLQELMSEGDAQLILERSHYKP
ncbi:MAG: hypothetical protein IJ650_00910 [Paludibacteraceae bacterium]|nr:hypothetical protein [Paludibacteraceae bacterium]